jgi:hypothetical protein
MKKSMSELWLRLIWMMLYRFFWHPIKIIIKFINIIFNFIPPSFITSLMLFNLIHVRHLCIIFYAFYFNCTVFLLGWATFGINIHRKPKSHFLGVHHLTFFTGAFGVWPVCKSFACTDGDGVINGTVFWSVGVSNGNTPKLSKQPNH